MSRQAVAVVISIRSFTDDGRIAVAFKTTG